MDEPELSWSETGEGRTFREEEADRAWRSRSLGLHVSETVLTVFLLFTVLSIFPSIESDHPETSSAPFSSSLLPVVDFCLSEPSGVACLHHGHPGPEPVTCRWHFFSSLLAGGSAT